MTHHAEIDKHRLTQHALEYAMKALRRITQEEYATPEDHETIQGYANEILIDLHGMLEGTISIEDSPF